MTLLTTLKSIVQLLWLNLFRATLCLLLPSIALFFCFAAYYQGSFWVAVVYFIFFLVANSFFMRLIAKGMVGRSNNLWSEIHWDFRQTDFFIFVNVGTVLLFFLTTSIAFTLPEIYHLILEYSDKAATDQTRVYTSDISTAKFKAGVSKALFLVTIGLVLTLWLYLCRVGIRLCAHADEKYMRADLALELIEHHKFNVYFCSALFVGGIVYYNFAVVAHLPEDLAPKLLPLIFAVQYCVLVYSHLAIWSHFYKKVKGMQRLPPVRQ